MYAESRYTMTISPQVATVLVSLCIAGVTAVIGLLWRMSRELAVTQATLAGLERRFGDHAKFIELILDRVLPEKG
jgi:hypothetical protein